MPIDRAPRLLDILKDVTAARWSKVDYGASYARQTREIIVRHGNPRVNAVDQTWVEGVVEDLARKCRSTATANRKLNCLQTVLTAAGVQHEIKRLPVPAPERDALTPIQLAEVDLWFERYATWGVRCLYQMLRDTGCRPGEELRRFKPELDAYYDRDEVRIRSKKGARGGEIPRIVPMTPKLKSLLTAAPISFMATEPAFNDAWRRMRKVVGIQYSPYCLRHTYCYRLLNAGIPLHVVARMMGHSNVNTTMNYIHVNAADRSSVLRALTD